MISESAGACDLRENRHFRGVATLKLLRSVKQGTCPRPCPAAAIQIIYVIGRRHRAAQQSFLGLPLFIGRQTLEEIDDASLQDRGRYTVAVKQAVSGERGQPRSWCQNADQVERVGAGD